MEIESGPIKVASNFNKHGVSFKEVATALYDEMALVQEDIESEGENRWILIGLSNKVRLLTVVYALRNNEIIRLISARKATKKEVKYYA
ncbi:MAG: BrnT family toxin [Proteobacteria bacterium]|nr:BrnT family toxin [Pseudomonadota bacterium]